MDTDTDYDAIVLGAGPAGNCAALRLLGLGHRVALVEQQNFPRPQIGESLSPGIWNIFRYLDAESLLHRPHYLPHLPAKVLWESDQVKTLLPEQRGPGILVDRSLLDHDLLQLGQERGLKVYQPVTFEQAERKGEGWEVKLNREGTPERLTTRFIVDARGRRGGVSAEYLGLARPLAAVWADLKIEPGFQETRIEVREEGWLWGTPLPGGLTRQMVLTDPAGLRTLPPAQLLAGLLQKSKLFQPTTLPPYAVQTCPVVMYAHAQPWEKGYLRIGEAALALDPLSSTGVEKAMRQALQTAIAIHTVLTGGDPGLARDFFEERMIEAAVTHTGWTRRYYGQAWPDSELPFWKDRAAFFLKRPATATDFSERLSARLSHSQAPPAPPTPPTHFPQLMAQLWGQRVGVSTAVQWSETPCVVADRLEKRVVLSHPGLDRKIAFLGEIEVVPLLQKVRAPLTFGELVQTWSQEMPFESASKMAVWLWQKEILQSAP